MTNIRKSLTGSSIVQRASNRSSKKPWADDYGKLSPSIEGCDTVPLSVHLDVVACATFAIREMGRIAIQSGAVASEVMELQEGRVRQIINWAKQAEESKKNSLRCKCND